MKRHASVSSRLDSWVVDLAKGPTALGSLQLCSTKGVFRLIEPDTLADFPTFQTPEWSDGHVPSDVRFAARRKNRNP